MTGDTQSGSYKVNQNLSKHLYLILLDLTTKHLHGDEVLYDRSGQFVEL